MDLNIPNYFNLATTYINYAHRGRRLKSDKKKIKKRWIKWNFIFLRKETTESCLKEYKAIIHHVAFKLCGRS
jgi:hypothetical protein